MKDIVVTLTYTKSTKNKHVFSHPDIGGFYLPISQVGTPVPTTLKATFSATDTQVEDSHEADM